MIIIVAIPWQIFKLVIPSLILQLFDLCEVLPSVAIAEDQAAALVSGGDGVPPRSPSAPSWECRQGDEISGVWLCKTSILNRLCCAQQFMDEKKQVPDLMFL